MFVYLQSQNRSYRSELPARRVGRSVRSFEIFAIRDVPKDERSTIWSDGRVARHRCLQRGFRLNLYGICTAASKFEA